VASLKRHGYYCRSRKGGKSFGAARSCLSCAKSKVRCDKHAPKCSRCVIKNNVCRYPQDSVQNPESNNQQTQLVSSVQTAASETSSFSGNETPGIRHCYAELCSETVNSMRDIVTLPDPRSETFDWDLSNISSMDYALVNNACITTPTDFDSGSTPRKAETMSPQKFMIEVQLMNYAPIASASVQIPRM
jgi:hypothetical protein